MINYSNRKLICTDFAKQKYSLTECWIIFNTGHGLWKQLGWEINTCHQPNAATVVVVLHSLTLPGDLAADQPISFVFQAAVCPIKPWGLLIIAPTWHRGETKVRFPSRWGCGVDSKSKTTPTSRIRNLEWRHDNCECKACCINWDVSSFSTRPDLTHKAPPFKEKDLNRSPKFTAPLVDRSVVAGYATAISCAVRGHPKVSTSLQSTSVCQSNCFFVN